MVKLGDWVKDKFSGFEGVVTGRAEYLYGCVSVKVTPSGLYEGKPIESLWLDEPQLIVQTDSPVMGFKPTGGPMPAPVRQQDARPR